VGNGVLSSLLHLYNHPSSAHSSSATLINYGSYDEDSECGGSRSNHSHRKTLRSGSASGHSRPSHDHAQSYQIQSQSQESSVPTQPTSFKNSSLELFRGALAKVKNSHFNSDRTTYQQKNNPTECVIGALQAGAIGLGAAAVPSVKDLAQDPEKNSATNNEQADQAPLQSDNPYHQEYSPTTIHRNYSQPNLRGRLRSPGTILSEDEDREGTSNHGSSTPDSDCNHDSNGRSTGNYHHRSSSSASISGSIFKQKIGKSPSIANLKALGDALRPTNFHNESSVLRAKKTSLNSVPGTPRDDLSSEKGRQHTLSRRKRERRRQEEIFITMHVAAILQRQEFILLLTRALMMFGGPSHRLESQIQSTAKVLDIDLQVVLIYSLCIFSFQDEATHTSETKFIKQSANLDLGKLTDLATLHWEVVHDKIGVQEASQEISKLMRSKPEYNNLKLILIGGLCSAFIGPAAFYSSFVDMLVGFVLGCGLMTIQVIIQSTQSDTLAQVFEIVICGLTSFVSGGLASTKLICYEAVLSSSIVLILPGWLVCCAALELQSRSIISGSVRLIWAVIYALFLGLGISLGAEFWTLFSGKPIELSYQGTCNTSHLRTHKWYFQTVPGWFNFLCVPAFGICLSMRQGARVKTKEFVVMNLLSVSGWTINHFASIGLPNSNQFSSALGSFFVGLVANIYGRLFQGTGFIVALAPILFQLPSGLGHGTGLLNFAKAQSFTNSNNNRTISLNTESAIVNGFQVAQQLIEVSIGLVIGLFMATVLVYPFGNKLSLFITFFNFFF
ncbi:pheromone-regulated membrane protein Prm10, partial [Phakopsora pachyrhizi]